MQVCLPKHDYKLDNILLTIEPRAVALHCFDADPEPDPAQNLDTSGSGSRSRSRSRSRSGGKPKMCIPPGKILGTPLMVCSSNMSIIVAEPDPDVFWASLIRIHEYEVRIRILLSSRKNSKKNLDSHCLVNSL